MLNIRNLQNLDIYHLNKFEKIEIDQIRQKSIIIFIEIEYVNWLVIVLYIII